MNDIVARLRRRRPRTRLAWLVLCAFALQQLALMAHACTVESLAEPEAIPMHLSECDGMDAVPPTDATLLCHQHCQSDDVTASDLKSPRIPALALPVSFAPPEALPIPVQALRYRGVPPCVSDPPATQRFCSLQI